MVKDIANLYQQQLVTQTEVLAASLRGVRDAAKAFQYGSDIITIPPKVFDGMYNHILTEKGLDLFDKDYAQTIQDLSEGKYWKPKTLQSILRMVAPTVKR